MSENAPGLQRVAWVDYAKGICIVAVVSMYSTLLVNDIYADPVTGGARLSWMNYWVDFARPFRMPDFFLLSGLFLARVIHRPWRDYFDKKVLHYFYFFVLWTLIIFVGRFDIARDVSLLERAQQLADMFVNPYAMLWFIQMLSVFCLVARWTRALPSGLVFLMAVGLEALHLDGDTHWHQLVRFCQYFVYFYGGYLFSNWIFRITHWAQQHVVWACVGLLAWASMNGYVVYSNWEDFRGVSLLLGFAGATAIAVSGALLSRYTWTDWLRYLGEHSIVVYLGFFLPLTAQLMIWQRFHLTWDQGWSTVFMIVVSILSALVVYWWTRDTNLDFLFHRPAWARLRPQAKAAGQPA